MPEVSLPQLNKIVIFYIFDKSLEFFKLDWLNNWAKQFSYFTTHNIVFGNSKFKVVLINFSVNAKQEGLAGFRINI